MGSGEEQVNSKKHGIAFEWARDMWDDPYYLEVHLRSHPEDRYAVIARLPFGIFTAVITYRGDSTIRIFSVRKATKKEAELYGNH